MITIGHTGLSLCRTCIFSQNGSCSIFRYTGKTIHTINLGSYNYLGFAEKTGPCATDAMNAIKSYGVATCSTRLEIGQFFSWISKNGIAIGSMCLGTQRYHLELEDALAEFLGVESCLAFGMVRSSCDIFDISYLFLLQGFATNALNLPAIASKVIESDSEEHL